MSKLNRIIFLTALLGISFITGMHQGSRQNNSLLNKSKILLSKNDTLHYYNTELFKELTKCQTDYHQNYDSCVVMGQKLMEYQDYTIRMKRICGVPDTIEWSYEVKCRADVVTKNIVGKAAINY